MFRGRKHVLLIVLLAMAPVGCGGADLDPPLNLTYRTPQPYPLGKVINPIQPGSTGGSITTYEVVPALPRGLVLDPRTGVISGTPTKPTPATEYTVTGSNAAASVQATMTISVLDPPLDPPLTLTYRPRLLYTVGDEIKPIKPEGTGGPITTYEVAPALTRGLVFDPVTGVISGTPTKLAPDKKYAVTGSNATASVRTTVTISVLGDAFELPHGRWVRMPGSVWQVKFEGLDSRGLLQFVRACPRQGGGGLERVAGTIHAKVGEPAGFVQIARFVRGGMETRYSTLAEAKTPPGTCTLDLPIRAIHLDRDQMVATITRR